MEVYDYTNFSIYYRELLIKSFGAFNLNWIFWEFSISWIWNTLNFKWKLNWWNYLFPDTLFLQPLIKPNRHLQKKKKILGKNGKFNQQTVTWKCNKFFYRRNYLIKVFNIIFLIKLTWKLFRLKSGGYVLAYIHKICS